MFSQKPGEEYIGLAKMIIRVFPLHLTSYRKTQMITLANPIFADGGRSAGPTERPRRCIPEGEELETFAEGTKDYYTLKQQLCTIKCSVQFSSIIQSCPTVCNPMNCITPGFPVHHQVPEFGQTHVHQGSDAILHHPLLLLSSIFLNTRVFSKESVLCLR